MAHFLATMRKAGNFTAGLLIGSAIVIAAFALTDIESSAWQSVLALGAPLVLALGLALPVLARVPRGIAGRRDAVAASIP